MKGTKFDFYYHNIKNKCFLFLKTPSFIGFYIKRFLKYNSLSSFPFIIISYPKSGRTWLQKMIIELVKLEYDLNIEISDISELENHSTLPPILSTHAGASWEEIVLSDNQIQQNDWSKYKHAKIIFLYRDPRDVLVSQYHHIRHRTGYKSFDKDYMIDNKYVGIVKILNFMNKWMRYSQENQEQILNISFENLKQNSESILKAICTHWGIEISDEKYYSIAVERCSLESMRKLEKGNSKSPWTTTNDSNSNSFQSRKGQIGEHKEFFTSKEINYLNQNIVTKLSPNFNYTDEILKN